MLDKWRGGSYAALLGLDVADDWYMLAIGQRPDGNASDSD